MLCIIPQLSITHFGNSVEPYGINSARAYQKKRHDVAFFHTFVQLSLHRDLVPDNPLSKNRYPYRYIQFASGGPTSTASGTGMGTPPRTKYS